MVFNIIKKKLMANTVFFVNMAVQTDSSCRHSFLMQTQFPHADTASSCRHSFLMQTQFPHADTASSCRHSFLMQTQFPHADTASSCRHSFHDTFLNNFTKVLRLSVGRHFTYFFAIYIIVTLTFHLSFIR